MKPKNAKILLALLAPLAGCQWMEPKTDLKLSDIVSSSPQTRMEVITTGLPADSDFYFTWEHEYAHTSSDFYRAKAQSLPLRTGPVSLGGVVQHIDGSEFDAHQEAGVIARLAGNISDGTFAKLDARYFPSTGVLDGIGLVMTMPLYFESIWSYNTRNGDFMARPSVEFNVGNGIYLGPEAMVKRTDSHTSVSVGAKVGIHF